MKQPLKFLWFSLLVLFSCKAYSQDDTGQLIPRIASLDLQPTPENPRTSEGDFIKLKQKKILTVYTKFTGGWIDESHAVLAARESSDGGLTWSDERIVVEKEGLQNIMSTTLLRLRNGHIALFYLVKNGKNDCYPVMRISRDEGKNWSLSTPCIPPGSGYFVLNNSRVIQLRNGRIILPVARHENRNGQFEQRADILCYYSDDNGQHWEKGSPVITNRPVVTQEPGVVELKDGTILMYIRTNAGVQYFTRSHDEGIHWETATPGNLTSPLSPATIVRNPYTRALIAVWNNHTTDRTPLVIASSYDEGKSWSSPMELENDRNTWFCYPAIEFPDKNSILISYCLGDKKQWGLGGMRINTIDSAPFSHKTSKQKRSK